MTRFVSGEAEMEENPILKASLSMASDIPLYAQLTGIIKNTITSGTLRVGDLLPSEAELCDKFEISRNTVRQAIGSLEEAGFVVRKRGKGTFVADPSTRRKGVQYSFTTEISSMGKHPSSTLVSFDIIDPAPKIKRLMALEDGVKVYCFTRVRNVDNEPLILETSYYPQHIYPNLTREMLETHSFYSLLYHVGVVPFAAEDSYEAVTLGEADYCILPLTASDGRRADSVLAMAHAHRLTIASVCGFLDGEDVPVRFALFGLVPRGGLAGEASLSLSFAELAESALAALIGAAACFGTAVTRVYLDGRAELTLRGGDMTAYLVYLCLFVPDFRVDGYYTEQ